jgi:hypothetical protein
MVTNGDGGLADVAGRFMPAAQGLWRVCCRQHLSSPGLWIDGQALRCRDAEIGPWQWRLNNGRLRSSALERLLLRRQDAKRAAGEPAPNRRPG